ncbi:MAG: enoyl-CoA hydratase-related protein [Pseudoxanthomonas sp.]
MPVPTTPSLSVQFDKDICTVVIDRPEARNAMNQQVVGDLIAILEHLHGQSDIRALVLRGQGATCVRAATSRISLASAGCRRSRVWMRSPPSTAASDTCWN